MSVSETRKQLISIFEDTIYQCENNPNLIESVKHSKENTVLFVDDTEKRFLLSIESFQRANIADLQITDERTIEAAQRLHVKYPNKKIAVLNFASAITPGGGVAKGSTAQEESICRCTSLYPTLKQGFLLDKFYIQNKRLKNCLHTNDCIYSPDVVVFKSDKEIPEMMPEKSWFKIDVISCSAPNLRGIPNNVYSFETGKPLKISDDDLYNLHVERAKHIFNVALSNNVDIIILGAFGCGAYRNNPSVVANAYIKAMVSYFKCFDNITYAIYCNPKDTYNHDIFVSTFRKAYI